MKATLLRADPLNPDGRQVIWLDFVDFSGTESTAHLITTDNGHAKRIADAVNKPGSLNQAAAFAATQARGPRCDRCERWTFRPEYTGLPSYIARLCPKCLPLDPELFPIKSLALTQVFRSDLWKFPYPLVIDLVRTEK